MTMAIGTAYRPRKAATAPRTPRRRSPTTMLRLPTLGPGRNWHSEQVGEFLRRQPAALLDQFAPCPRQRATEGMQGDGEEAGEEIGQRRLWCAITDHLPSQEADSHLPLNCCFIVIGPVWPLLDRDV